MVTMNWPHGTRPYGSCGLPMPGLAVRLVDPATGADAPPGGEGELWVRGPNVMRGYHNKPEQTADVLVDGWYRTGDLARADVHGYLTISGRTKEMIIRGGENIYPAEVENALLGAPGVADAAVVGRPHADLGEVPVAFVVADPGADGTGRRGAPGALPPAAGVVQGPGRLPPHRHHPPHRLGEDQALRARPAPRRRRRAAASGARPRSLDQEVVTWS